MPLSPSSPPIAFHVSEPEKISQIRVYPNPVITGSRHFGKVTFDNLPADCSIRIYGINGQLIKMVEKVENERYIWFIDNNNGHESSCGVYIYVIESSGVRRSGKIAVIK